MPRELGLSFLHAVDDDGSLIGANEARDDVHEGRLAAARGAHDGHEFAVADAEADSIDHAQRAPARSEALPDVLDFELSAHTAT